MTDYSDMAGFEKCMAALAIRIDAALPDVRSPAFAQWRDSIRQFIQSPTQSAEANANASFAVLTCELQSVKISNLP
jgi:hypothetical protein